jgi:hypothetical protein
MSATAAAAVRTWSVGKDYRCTLTLPKPTPGASLSWSVEWEPYLPERLSQSEISDYLAGRNKALAELSQELGLRAMVIDV